jgi:hypothetical protein
MAVTYPKQETSYDVKISVTTFETTHFLTDEDANRIYDVGAFVYTPPDTILFDDSAPMLSLIEEKPTTDKSRLRAVSSQITDMLKDLTKIFKVFANRASDITYAYDVKLPENENLANSEEAVFGVKSGMITYEKYLEVLNFEAKIDKWLSQKSIVNKGNLNATTGF